MTRIRIISGVSRANRSATLDALVRQHWPRACLLLPTKGAARARRENILLAEGLGGAVGVRIASLMEFAETLLQLEGRLVRRMDNLERKLLLHAIVEEIAAGMPDNHAIHRHKEQNGFVNHLLRIVTDLKQSTIEPAELKAALDRMGAPLSAFDDIVVAAYERYQAVLKERRSYDVPGVYWEAHQVCAVSTPRMLKDVDVLVLDGFDDFTPSETRFLAALAPHLKEMAIGLHLDHAPNRADLFQLPAQTAKRLQALFPAAQQDHCDAPPPESHTEFAADNVFWRDEPKIKTPLRENLTIQPCLNPQHELEWIARDIKAAILRGDAEPGEIALVFRHLNTHANALRAVFQEYGIPLDLAHQPTLAEQEFGILLQTLFAVKAEWRRGDVLHVLASPRCKVFHGDGAPPESFQYLTAHAQIIAGAEEWRQRLDILQGRLDKPRDKEEKDHTAGNITRRVPQAAAVLNALRHRFEALHEMLTALPERATMREHLGALDMLLEKLDVLPAADQNTKTMPPPDIRAWQTLVLRCDMCFSSDTPITWDTFAARITAALCEIKVTSEKDTRGVRCSEPEHLRGMSVKRVYLAHMLEQVFPAPASTNAIYGQDAQEALRRQGMDFDTAAHHSARERLLLHHVLEAAQDRLVITWPIIKADGRESSRSAFLDEVINMFEGAPLHTEPAPPADGFLPEPDRVASQRELLQLAFYKAGAWQKEFRDLAQHALAACEIESLRNSDAPFDHTDACLGSADIRAKLAERFNAESVYSPSQLEAYRECPFQYWKKYVLNLEETETPVMEFDPRVRGLVVHEVLERFHSHYKGIALPDIPEDEAAGLLQQLTQEAFVHHAWKSATATDSILAVEQIRIQKLLLSYFHKQSQKKNENEWKPEHFETAFGIKAHEDDGLSTEVPFTLDVEGGAVKLRGRIDRIDLDAAGAVRLVDYKTGGLPKQKDVESGISLQLHIYKWALEGLLMPGHTCQEARYISIQTGKDMEVLKKGGGNNADEQRDEAVKLGILHAVSGIQNGYFLPMRPKGSCMGCAQARACRFDEGRMARKAVHMPDGFQWENAETEEEDN